MIAPAAGPVFIVGAQRSGTTLMGRWLNEHPDVFCTVDGKLLYYLVVWLLRDPAALAALHPRLDEVIHALYRDHYRGRGAGDDARRLAGVLEQAVPAIDPGRTAARPPAATVARLWRRCYRTLAGDRPVFGDKYNEYLLQLDEIDAVFPDARFVFLVREPSATVRSMQRHFAGRPWQPQSAGQTLAKWAAWNARWIDFRRRLAPGRRIEVQYETLVADPVAAAARIQHGLALAPDPEHRCRLAERVERFFAEGRGEADRRTLVEAASLAGAGPEAADPLDLSTRQVARALGYPWPAAAIPDLSVAYRIDSHAR